MIHFRSALASSNSCGLQTLHCFLFLGLMMNYHWKLQCMYFRFHFQKNPQWKCHSQGHWLTLKVNVVGDKSASVIFVSRFPISRAGISGSLPYKDIRYIESCGTQLIHTKRLTYNPNTQLCVRYTLLVMDSCHGGWGAIREVKRYIHEHVLRHS